MWTVLGSRSDTQDQREGGLLLEMAAGVEDSLTVYGPQQQKWGWGDGFLGQLDPQV